MKDGNVSRVLFASLWSILLDQTYKGLFDQVFAVHPKRKPRKSRFFKPT